MAAANKKNEKVGVIDAKKIRVDVLKRSLELVGEPTNGSTEELIRRLATWMNDNRTTKGDTDLVHCSECGFVADITKLDDSPLPPICPACGVGDSDDQEKAEKSAPTNAAPEPKEEQVVHKGEVVDMQERRGKTAAKAPGGLTRVAKPKTAAAAAMDKVRESGDEAELNAHTEGYVAAIVEGAVKAIAHLKAIDDGKLWKQRLDRETGKKAYESFADYAAKELKLSKGVAYKQLAVAKTFSEEQIRTHGWSKLALAPKFESDEQKQAYLKELEKGASKRDLESKGGDEERVAKISLPCERLVLDLLARGKGDPKPAKKIEDDPHVELTLKSGDVVKFRLQKSKKTGGWQLVVAPSKKGAAE